jgi:hypothetical protein
MGVLMMPKGGKMREKRNSLLTKIANNSQTSNYTQIDNKNKGKEAVLVVEED